MLIVPGYAYDFKFKSLLSSLNGIYQVSSLLSYEELINTNVDLFASTYEPLGLDEVAYDSDLNSIREGKTAKLVSVNNPEEIWYVPEHLFDIVPDGSVQRYLHLGLAVDLGVFDDSEQLELLKEEIEQIVQTKIGVSQSAIIYSVKDAWMSKSEFQLIEAARLINIEQTNNHYTDKLKLQKEVDRLKTLITYYEDTLKTLAI